MLGIRRALQFEQVMASMSFPSASSSFATLLHNFSQANLNANSSSSWPSMAFVVPSLKTSFGSSKSAFFQHGFPQISSNFPGFAASESRSSGVYARAATEKSIHDFTVKVSAGFCILLFS